INQDLKKYGYQSGFLFGGDLNYGNIKGYVLNKAFDIVKEEKDIDPKYARGKLGIQDNDMINVLLENLNAAQTPFVFAWFTLSTHMPYDFEGAKKNLVNHKENDYINSIVFSDHALREFFEKAKNTNWYKNTLFVFVADHSHADHKDFGVYDAEYHHIPLIFFGDVIKPEFRGKEIRDVFSQLDITPTLLKQMGLNTEAGQYVWGRNMFNPYSRHFAYFSTFAGGGVVSDEGKIGYQHGLDKLIINSFGPGNPKSTELKRLGKAFQQTVFEDYRLK
ncbi:MAG TPA: LTA synthase family protein, partial [Saprospiraceae bacterium]|nr:LTA synthase family protein [Saprospiraceae bacterium]